MDGVLKFRFENYLFGQDKSYEMCNNAISDLECFEIAKQIIALHDSFVLEIKNPTKEQARRYYEEVYTFLVNKFGETSRLVEDVQTEITALKKGFSYVSNDGRSYADDINRIRAVFDLYYR